MLKPDQVDEAITDRMTERWPKRFTQERAAPFIAIGVVQQEGHPNYGMPVVCLPEDSPEPLIAKLLRKIADELDNQARATRRK